MIQDELVEVPAAGLLADVLVHDLLAEALEGYGVGQRLAAALQGERYGRVADAEPLAVARADRDAPVLRVHARQLGYVRGDLALDVGLALPVEVLDVLGEAREVRDDELVPEGPRDQDYVRRDDSARMIAIYSGGTGGRGGLPACFNFDQVQNAILA